MLQEEKGLLSVSPSLCQEGAGGSHWDAERACMSSLSKDACLPLGSQPPFCELTSDLACVWELLALEQKPPVSEAQRAHSPSKVHAVACAGLPCHWPHQENHFLFPTWLIWESPKATPLTVLLPVGQHGAFGENNELFLRFFLPTTPVAVVTQLLCLWA